MAFPVSPSHSDQQRRAFWLRHLHQWHWISSALCLTAMLLFAVSGITLNHSAQIQAHPRILKKAVHLPAPVLQQLKQAQRDDSQTLPENVRDWLKSQLAIRVEQQVPEWTPEEVYVALPRPGGDAWLRIGLGDGALEYELTDRGWIAYINDLHKGRNTGVVWNYLIDAFAVLCLIFCMTGFFLLKMHAKNRPSTWPIVVFGVVLPMLLALTFIH
ncbi:PepSY-associated TM helix domain-containing protein [Undibacterium jejuense]|uniref:PepSY-associated TM helix domain-containing protein n=1 Tax=Undibacterium jejuense TaxID=1344949 RepID=A0A923HHR4_9BURK|nr:PepSY-associated TM helix domain-containing protein [Undibacterium jejuense]MBC3862370.1 PepSY-associated TM helix domain-containing protein [Undibacterium jejuense]